ncbi:EamA family transporter [Mycolicibacterium komossense]|uniref:EamA family transporter n=1 Tax=Mycolicibacterium komossense TaxID=1779 RepID=UPI0021F31B10|nr:EamA family transporter [Mycolicibacterium komossense]
MPALLAVAAATAQEFGAAFAVGLFASLGVAGTVFARFLVASIVLCVMVRPRIHGLDRRAFGAIVALAVTLTTMNLLFYEALSRIPLGIAVTVEICGPLLLSVLLNRRWAGWIWALVAFSGVALLGLGGGPLPAANMIGLVLAAGAAVSWAGYILATAHAGKVFANLDALALATVLGALLTAPAAVLSVNLGAALHWEVAGLVVVVGLMCSVIPYSLELIALRSLPASTFAVLTSLSPAIAAVAGWLILRQQLGLTDYLAVSLVVIASAGAVRSTAPLGPNRSID